MNSNRKKTSFKARKEKQRNNNKQAQKTVFGATELKRA